MKDRVLLSFLATIVLAPRTASAHFVLNQPPSWQQQDSLGDPQKKGPCGDAGTKTNTVTKLMAGQMVHFDFTETITHGGHYRIALGLKGQGDLPADPLVNQKNGVSIDVPIQNPAVFPVLADGINPHNASDIKSGKKWTYDVKLPAGMTCDACVLQITQFMTDHGSNTGGNDGFFYHHCANVQILAAAASDGGAPVADAAVSVDVAATGGMTGGGTGGMTGGSTGGTTGGAGTGGARATGGSTGGNQGNTGGSEETGGEPPKKSPGGGCAVGGDGAGSLLALLLAAGYFRKRARR
jgi:hypothetical protein